MKQAVIRKTLEGNWEPFNFQKNNKNFFVKNFTNNDIFVSFEENDEESASFKIAAGYGEELSVSQNNLSGQLERSIIYIKGTGEVEVEALDIYFD